MDDRPQSWDDADPDVRAHVLAVADVFAARLGERLSGVVLHGSLAMGSFRRGVSDLDLLVVADDDLAPDLRRALALDLVALADRRPIAGDVELSAVRARDAAAPFVHPMPFTLHYGPDWREAIRRGETDFAAERTDPDLAAHVTVARARGIALLGPPPDVLFAPVPWEHYLDAVRGDLAWLLEDENFCDNPPYAVLNLCRVWELADAPKGTVRSKEEGGAWGRTHLPATFAPLIDQALAHRRGAAVAWDRKALLALRDWARAARQPLYRPLK